METEGLLEPESEDAARERYADLEPAAGEVLGAVARTMLREDEDYDDRVTDAVRQTAHEAIFASLLRIHVGTREELDDWMADRDDSLILAGNENVENAAWHRAALDDTVVAATFQDRRRAAVDTLRRQAFARVYREVV